MSRKLTANTLKAASARRFVKLRQAVNFELGLCRRGRLRADVIAMSMKGEFTIIEVKSCVADFVADSKCADYLKYANKFYFAFDEKTWTKLEPRVKFPPEVGAMILVNGKFRVVKKCKRQELSDVTKMQLAIRMAYRGSEFTSLKQVNAWRRKHVEGK